MLQEPAQSTSGSLEQDTSLQPETIWKSYEYNIQIDGGKEYTVDISTLLGQYPDLSEKKKDLVLRLVGDRQIFPGNIDDVDRLANQLGPTYYGGSNEYYDESDVLSDACEWIAAMVDYDVYPFSIASRLTERIFDRDRVYIGGIANPNSMDRIDNKVNRQIQKKLPRDRYQNLGESEDIYEWYKQLMSFDKDEIELLLLAQGLDKYCDEIAKENSISHMEKILHLLNNGKLFGALGRFDLWEEQLIRQVGTIKPLPSKTGSCFTVPIDKVN